MTRMPRIALFPIAGLALVALSAGAGCGPDPKQQRIDQLAKENDQLRADLADRDRQLNDAAVREDDARKTIDDLNGQMAKIRAEGAKAKDTDGWTSFSGFDMISIPGEVLFDSGKADLKTSGRSTLDRLASDIRSRFPDRDIYVFGHTDNEPIAKSKWKDNWELGAYRALNVIRHLRGAGVSEQSLVQANCSQFRPRAGNTSEAGKRQNRRVEFYAVERKGGLIKTSAARSRDGE